MDLNDILNFVPGLLSAGNTGGNGNTNTDPNASSTGSGGFNLSSLFPAGLLSPSSMSPDRMAMMNMAAELMKAGGTPSPVKGGSWGRGLGAAVSGLASGYQQASDQQLKRQLVQGQLSTQQLAIMQRIAELQALGLPVPPALQAMAAGVGPGASAAQLAPSVPSVPPLGGSSATGGLPAAPGSSASPPGATPPPPAAVPNGTAGGAPGTGGPTLADRAQTMFGNRGAIILPNVQKAVTDAAAHNAEETPEMKNARANGYKTPEEMQRAQKSIEEDQKMGNGAFSAAQAGQTLRNLVGRLKPALENPNMATGPFFDVKKLSNDLKTQFGIDAGAAAPTEQVRLMAAQEMLNTMREVSNNYEAAGEKPPRWFQTMVEQVQGTLADPSKLSLPALNNAMERMKREGNRDYEIGREMLDFREAHGGKLGDPWRKRQLELRNDDIFNKEETAAFNGLAAPPPGSGLADIRPQAIRDRDAKPTVRWFKGVPYTLPPGADGTKKENWQPAVPGLGG